MSLLRITLSEQADKLEERVFKAEVTVEAVTVPGLLPTPKLLTVLVKALVQDRI